MIRHMAEENLFYACNVNNELYCLKNSSLSRNDLLFPTPLHYSFQTRFKNAKTALLRCH